MQEKNISHHQHQQLTNTKKDFNHFTKILNEPIEKRSTSDTSNLIQYLSQFNTIATFTQLTSLILTQKMITKCSQIVHKPCRSILVEENDELNFIYILLKGKLESDKPKQELDLEQLENINKKVLENKIGKKGKKIKAKDKEQNENLRISKNIRESYNLRDTQTPKENKFKRNEKDKELKIKENHYYDIEIVAIEDLSLGQNKYISTITVAEDSFLLQIDADSFLDLLSNYFLEKTNNLYSKLCNFACFKGIEEEKINKFIMNLSEKQQKRGYQIYKYKQEVNKIYLLINGEIKLTKESNLEMENPNEFFANRAQLLKETPKKENFSRRYSYKSPKSGLNSKEKLPFCSETMRLLTSSPQKKRTIEISQVSSLCFFGVEELLENKTRETNAVCHSLDVTYYEIEIGKAKEILGAKSMIKFIQGLRTESTYKVLYRQNNLAAMINIEDRSNKANISLENDEKDHKKFRVSKANKKENDESDYKSFISPQYTISNFHKARKSAKKIPVSVLQRYDNPEFQVKAEFNREHSPVQTHNAEELKIFSMSHTWKLIKKKVDSQIVKSTKISPIKHSMEKLSYFRDVNQPLIGNDFLKNLEKEKLRIEKKIRKDKITVGQNRHSSLSSQTNI